MYILNGGGFTIYNKGDYVICKFGGIWLVSQEDAGEIRLIEHERDNIQTLPADSNEIVRKIASKETILEVIDRIPFIRTIQAPNDKIRQELYEDAMAKYDEIAWVSVIKTAYLRQESRRFMPCEIEYSKRAKAFLYGEVSVALGMPTDKVEEYIASAVASDTW